MKTKTFILLSICLLSVSKFAMAQATGMYWGIGATWVELVTWPNGHYYNIYKHINDTIVNGKVYHKIRLVSDPNISNRLLLRDSAGVLFSLGYYGASCTEMKITDFNSNSGDTITLTPVFEGLSVSTACTSSGTSKMRIDSVWYDNSTGTPYRLLKVRELYSSILSVFVERIGTEKFLGNSCDQLMSPGGFCLKCFSSNDTIYYLNMPGYKVTLPPGPYYTMCNGCYNDPDGVATMGKLVKIPGRCDTISQFVLNVDRYLSNKTQEYQIFPTLVEDKCYIKSHNKNFNLEIQWIVYDVLGREIKKGNIFNEISEIDLSIFDKGAYIIMIKNKDDILFSHKIIKL